MKFFKKNPRKLSKVMKIALFGYLYECFTVENIGN
jgi:hypothetical protein